jgi:hypothetical protein
MHAKNSTPISIKPMTKDVAAKLTKRMLGSYPSVNLEDPETYITAVIAVLCKYPHDVGKLAIDNLSNTLKFIPTIAEIKAACEVIAAPRRQAAEWNARSQAQLAERERLALPAPVSEHDRVVAGFDNLLATLRKDQTAIGKPANARPWTRYTDAELERMYPPQPRTAGE